MDVDRGIASPVGSDSGVADVAAVEVAKVLPYISNCRLGHIQQRDGRKLHATHSV
jgi:hypothetical protein